MRVVLVQPPLTPEGAVQPPVGLCALAAWLRLHGHEPRIVDLDLHVRDPARGGWEGCVARFDEALANFRPDVVGFTSMYSNSLHAIRLVRRCRERHPEVITLAGGSHFGALATETLVRYPELDFVISGEGEGPLRDFLAECAGQRDWARVPALAWRDGDRVVLNKPGALIDLADVPDPWTLGADVLDLRAYLDTDPGPSGERAVYVEAGRGCPFACSFCATAPFWRRKYRVKSADQIVAEMSRLREIGYSRFILVHDLLTANLRFVAQLCDALMASGLPLPWMANSRIDIDLKGLLPRMKAAGCWKLFFGVESASDEMQLAIDKHLAIDDAYETVAELARQGLTATCSFVIGYPEESRAALGRSIAAGARLKVIGAEIVQFHRLRVWPPAPLAARQLEQAFDPVSAAIEYPFVGIPEVDLLALSSDPVFFSGYFPPVAGSGTADQIAQFEMFAHHATAIAPMTLYLLAAPSPEAFVDAFYVALEQLGPIAREELDWDGGRLLDGWRVISPYLSAIHEALPLKTQEAAMVAEVLGYEDRRIVFACAAGAASGSVAETSFVTAVDIPGLIKAIQTGAPADDGLLRDTQIRFRREPEDRFRCFASPIPAACPKQHLSPAQTPC
jgi:radical SAM superfamily enzyme YgiQ (UPF0313 family)